MTPLTRAAIQEGWIQRLLAERADIKLLSPEELALSRATVLARAESGADVWLFAYGSLIWNPAFHAIERRIGRVHGWHRRFCLWTDVGRGTPEHPGLVLGLESGGSCTGVAYRIAAAEVETELDIVWRREMVTGAYRPTWVMVGSTSGPVQAIAFVINRRHDRYAGRLSDDAIVSAVAAAAGPLGTCAEYLFSTVTHLAELGLADRALERLAAAVRLRDPGPLPRTI